MEPLCGVFVLLVYPDEDRASNSVGSLRCVSSGDGWASRPFVKRDVLLVDAWTVPQLRIRRRPPQADPLKADAVERHRHALAKPGVTTQRRYLLQSHILASASCPGRHIERQVMLEQAIARELGMGLFAPFHIKSLKRLIGVARFGPCPLDFFALLLQHARHLLHQRQVALVVDDLDGLLAIDPDRAVHILEGLIGQGFLVLVKPSTDLEMPSCISVGVGARTEVDTLISV